MKLTARQREVLAYLQWARTVRSSSDGSILRALAKKGLVMQHHNTAPGYVYYTWTLTEAGRAIESK
jgi:hypothetical protein